ncbi:MAG: DUF4920 domain-containing protein [Flavobacteriales bacterium]
MKYLITLISVAMLLFSCSQPVTPAKVEGEKSYFGEQIAPENVMTVTQLQSKMTSNDSLLNVSVKGEILETCAVKGCWMTIANGDSEPMRVRFKDYGFFVPTEGAGGKETVFTGKAFKDEVSVEWQHHYIDDSAASEEEKEKLKAEITEPKSVVSFLADGVIIEGLAATETK